MSNSDITPVRIGLVGAGAIMRLSHAPVIAKSKIATLAAVFDVDLPRAEAIVAKFGGKAFDNLDAMLERGNVDAVIVATPNDAHPTGVIAAAERGKHVLCEKPLAIGVADCRRMIEACAAKRAGTPDEVGTVGALLMGSDGPFISGSAPSISRAVPTTISRKRSASVLAAFRDSRRSPCKTRTRQPRN